MPRKKTRNAGAGAVKKTRNAGAARTPPPRKLTKHLPSPWLCGALPASRKHALGVGKGSTTPARAARLQRTCHCSDLPDTSAHATAPTCQTPYLRKPPQTAGGAAPTPRAHM